MKSTYYLDLLRGRAQELPDVRSKIVRVFVSSTFTGNYVLLFRKICSSHCFLSDTLAERDSLIENIFPKLKDYCREKYGLEFQVCSSFSFTIEYFLFTFSMPICDGEFKRNLRIIMEK